MKLLDHLQVQYDPDADNIKTECIHCGSDALSIDVEPPHQYQCFKCHQTGNAYTFMRKWYELLPPLSKSQAVNLCSLKKGLKPLTLREAGLKFFNDCYWYPVYNQKNSLMALHKYVVETNTFYSSPKPTSLTILGLNHLGKSDTVWIAEGHFDYLTLLPQMAGSNIDLLGTCGSYFNSAYLSALKDKHIVMLYDNDQAGRDGIDYVARHIKSNSIPHFSLSYLDWDKITIPSGELTQGFDVRDLNNVFAGVV